MFYMKALAIGSAIGMTIATNDSTWAMVCVLCFMLGNHVMKGPAQ